MSGFIGAHPKAYRHTLWHFLPELALSTAIIGLALWLGNIPALAGVGLSALTLTILCGMIVGNTVYPKIWQQCDGRAAINLVIHHLIA